jgi:hypothetical protein
MADTNSNMVLTTWPLCIFCQEVRDEGLICPAESKRQNIGAGYNTLADDLINIQQIGQLPKSLNLSRLDDGDGISTTLASRRARWHKTCMDTYNKTKLSRLQKRHLDSDFETSTCGVSKRRRSATPTEINEPTCFLCDKPAKHKEWRNASTYELDCKVRSASLRLGDTDLLAKLAGI